DLVRGPVPGAGAGADRVPPHLLQRPPLRGRPADQRRGPGRGVHGDHPARHRGRRARLLPPRHPADHRRLAAGPAGQAAALAPRRADGLAGHRRLRADRRPRLRPARRHPRPGGARPVADRHDAVGLRPGAAPGRPPGPGHPRADRPELAPRRVLRPRAVPGPGARGLALRRHHRRGPAHGLHPRGRRPVLVPARHPRRGRGGHPGGGQRPRRARPRLLGPDDRRHRARRRGRLRGDRLAAALHQPPHLHPLRALPDRARLRGVRAARDGGAGAVHRV
ncbi:MAG: Undecaprenyl-diphosphatase, partial [uncultured Quadrisphaera sp.]